MSRAAERPAFEAWIGALPERRAGALARLAEVQFPGRKEELWRTLRLATLNRFSPQPAGPERAVELAGARLGEPQIVSVDGRISIVDDALASVASIESEPEGLGELAGHVGGDVSRGAPDYFVAANDAARSGALVVRVGKHEDAGTIRLLSVARPGSVAAARVLVRLAPGARLCLIEEHRSAPGEGASLSIPVVEVHVGDGAHFEHVRLQEQGEGAMHVARMAVSVGRDAAIESVSVATGADLYRADLHAVIGGPGSSCALHGLALVGDGQISDTHSLMHHTAQGSRSDQLHKIVAGGKAHGVFNGRIRVERPAQQTNAFQLARTLLLSPRARVDAKPQLEIFADDVKCSHGATIGQLDAEQLFYLRARGIERADALAMLTYAFAAEVTDHVGDEQARGALADVIVERSPGSVS